MMGQCGGSAAGGRVRRGVWRTRACICRRCSRPGAGSARELSSRPEVGASYDWGLSGRAGRPAGGGGGACAYATPTPAEVRGASRKEE
jgi:hypothetical protein